MKEINYQKSQLVCQIMIAATAFTAVLVYMRPVLVPLMFALFYYTASLPLMKFFQSRLKFPKILSMLSTIGIVLFVSFVMIILMTQSLNSFVKEISIYQKNFLTLIEQVVDMGTEYGVHLNRESIRKVYNSIPVFSYVRQFSGGAFGFIGNSFLIFIIYIFLIMGQRDTSSKKHEIQAEIEDKVSSYVITKSLISIATGVLFLIVLLSFGVDLAIMFGILTVFLNFIPNIGSLIATVLPLPVIILQYGFGVRLFLIVLLGTLIQVIVGNIIEPKLLGDDLDLHPISILLFLIFWGLVWGVAGMLLAVPMTAILKIVLSRFQITHKLSELLAGRF